MKRLLPVLAATAALALPAAAHAGKPYVIGNVNGAKPTVTAGDGVFHVVWNDEASNVFHYCKVLATKAGCAGGKVLAFNDAADGGSTGAPGKAWVVRGYDNQTLYLVHAQYVSGDTYVWTSTDAGGSFTGPVKVWGGVNGVNGTDSERPLLVPATNTIAFPTTNTGLFAYDAPIDGSGAASEAKANLDQSGLGIRSYGLGLATIAGGGTLATADDLANVYSWSKADAAPFADAGSWGPPKLVGPGTDSTLAGDGGQNYLGYTTGSGGTRRFEIRKATGTSFGAPKVIVKEPGYQARMTVAPGGGAGAVWRDNGTGLRYASTDDGGKTFVSRLVTNSDEIYPDLEVARDDDGHGLAVWTRNGAVAAADLTEVHDPTAPQKSTTRSKRGTTLGLNVPGSCVVPGKSYRITVGGQGRNKVVKVVFRFGGQSATDTKKPWAETFKVPSSSKPGATIKVSANSSVEKKGADFKLLISSSVTVCGG
jgi:hypothetical protein